MKTFKNFFEDTKEIRQQLSALGKEDAASRRLEARREEAKKE
jgi:hypothetical protein